jgi:hypothetical protein
VIDERTERTLERIAKGLFYPDRAYGAILRRAAETACVADAELEALAAWLPTGRVDQKRLDALAMLRSMREHLASNPRPKRVRYTFERTVWWEHATITAGELHIEDGGGGEAMLLQALLEEAQLDGESYAAAHDAALLRYLAVRYAAQASATPGGELQQSTADRFRRRQGLLQAEDVEFWLAENQLTRERFNALLHDQALLEWTAAELAGDITRRLADELRLSGRHTALLARARQKQRALALHGWENPSLDEIGLNRDELVEWYFNRLGRPLATDLEDYANRSGFHDADAFVRALIREFCFIRCLGQEMGHATPVPAV